MGLAISINNEEKSLYGQVDPVRHTALVQDECIASLRKLACGVTKTSPSSGTVEFLDPTQMNVTALINVHCDLISIDINDEHWKNLDLIDWDELKSTTDSPSIYNSTPPSLTELISFVRNHLNVPYADELANRLDYLLKASIEEAPEQDPISQESLCGFIKFLDMVPNLVEPDVVLSLTGNICAEWYRSPREFFSVEFLPTGQTHYVVFSRDSEYPSQTDRASGVVSANSLLTKVKHFNVLSWAMY